MKHLLTIIACIAAALVVSQAHAAKTVAGVHASAVGLSDSQETAETSARSSWDSRFAFEMKRSFKDGARRVDPTPLKHERLCTDGKDNDGDGFVDCNDEDCWYHAKCKIDDPVDVVEICDNEIDDDDNGLIDCEDSACSDELSCTDDPDIADPNLPGDEDYPEAGFGADGGGCTIANAAAVNPMAMILMLMTSGLIAIRRK